MSDFNIDLIEVKEKIVNVRHGLIKNFNEYLEVFIILDSNIDNLSDKKRYKRLKKNILTNKIGSNEFIMFLNREIEIAESQK